jgi:hypothetical protein
MREGAVRIVGPVGEDGPRRPSPPRFWLFVAPVIAVMVVGWLLVQDTAQEASEFRTEYSVPGFDASFDSFKEFLPPPENAFGYTWSQIALVEGDSEMTAVIGAGEGLVTVGSSNGTAAAWTSVDGAAWSRIPVDDASSNGDSAQSMNSVTVGGPGLVAVGHTTSGDDTDATVWTSVDGTAWTRLPHDEAVFGAARLYEVVAGGLGLVAIGEDTDHEAIRMWTSVDGFAWSQVPYDESVFASATIYSVAGGGQGLVAVGHTISNEDTDAVVWTSTDGLSWSRVPHDESVFGGEGDQAMFDVTAGGPGLVAVGSGASVWTSIDGRTWTLTAADDTGLSETFEGAPSIVSIASNGTDLVAVGDAGYFPDTGGRPVWISKDGVVWTRFIGERVFDADLNLVIARATDFLLFSNHGIWAATPIRQ